MWGENARNKPYLTSSYFFRCRNLYTWEVQPSDCRWLFSSKAVSAACFKFSEMFLLAAGNLCCLWSTRCFTSKKRFWSCWKFKNWFIWANDTVWMYIFPVFQRSKVRKIMLFLLIYMIWLLRYFLGDFFSPCVWYSGIKSDGVSTRGCTAYRCKQPWNYFFLFRLWMKGDQLCELLIK